MTTTFSVSLSLPLAHTHACPIIIVQYLYERVVGLMFPRCVWRVSVRSIDDHWRYKSVMKPIKLVHYNQFTSLETENKSSNKKNRPESVERHLITYVKRCGYVCVGFFQHWFGWKNSLKTLIAYPTAYAHREREKKETHFNVDVCI